MSSPTDRAAINSLVNLRLPTTGLEQISAKDARTVFEGLADSASFRVDNLSDLTDTAAARTNLGVPSVATTITAGTGLTGGGSLAANLTLALSSTSIASLALADTAVQPTRAVNSGTGLTGGGNLSADRTLALDGQALALHNLAANGLIARTGAGTVAGRTLTAGTGVTVTNGDGVSGNPTAALSSGSIASLALADTAVQPARTITAGAGLTGGGNLSADRTLAFDVTTAAFTPSGTGAVTTTVDAELKRQPVSPEQYGAVGDGVTDDTAAFIAAMAVRRYVRGTPGKTYTLGDLATTTNSILDLRGCIIKRASGAKHAIVVTAFHGGLIGADVVGGFDYQQTTIPGGASAAAATVTVADATGLAVGMKCFYASSWRGGVEINEITAVSGTTITLRAPVKGTVTAGTRFVADHAMVKIVGSSAVQGDIHDLWVRSCLVCVQLGETGVISGNVFSSLSNIRVSSYLGAGFVFEADMAGEHMSGWLANGGRTQTVDYTGDGSTVAYAYPWSVTPKVHRWGSGTSIRVFVAGSQLDTTQYTADPSTGQVTLNVAPSAGVAVQVQNYEWAVANLVASGLGRTSASSVERLVNGLSIAAVYGLYFEGCELGYLTGIISDTCSYSAALFVGCTNTHVRASDFLYSPFPVIFDETCSNCSISGFGTSIMPDSAELTPTANKVELTVEAGASNVQVDFDSWHSNSGYTAAIGASLRRRQFITGGGALYDIVAGGANQTAEIQLKSSFSTADRKIWRISNSGADSRLKIRNVNDAEDTITNIADFSRDTGFGTVFRLGQQTTDIPGVGNTTAGATMFSDGRGIFSRAAAASGFFNRNNDGDAVAFSRSGVQVGSVSVTATATAYNTSSDETLKDFTGEYSPEQAIAVIKADPVREFNWKSDGSYAVGWGAQTSYAVSPDLATPGGWFDPETGEPWQEGGVRWVNPMTHEDASEDDLFEQTLHDEEGLPVGSKWLPAKKVDAEYVAWGVDQSKRTPYLWAAMTGLIARVEALEAEIASMKAGS